MKSFDEVLKDVKNAAIAGHVKPDGDCVGSCLGLYEYLRVNYPKIRTHVFLDPFPDGLAFLAEGKTITDEKDADEHYDVVFALDCADPDRVGAGKKLMKQTDCLVCIDHHISNPGYGDITVIEPDASSACEVVYSLMDDDRLTKETAVCLYTGIVHDTGVFQYSCVSPLTMQRAGQLMRFGFDSSDIIMKSVFEKTISHQKLIGLALERSMLTTDGEGIWSYVSSEDFKALGSSRMETEGAVETLRNTKGIDYSVFLSEDDEGTWRCSFRSKGGNDVSRAACAFGGGGHTRAAGCSFPAGKTPQEMIDAITAQIVSQRENR